MALVKHDEKWTRELAKIEVVRESMASCQALTDNMMDILQTFEDKLEALDHTIQPILRKTQVLTQRQHNIKNTIDSVEKIIKNADLANGSTVNIPSIDADYRAYLEWLSDVYEGVQYFKERTRFRKADQALYKLKDLLEDGVKECMRVFTRRVTPDRATHVAQPYKSKALLRKDRWVPGVAAATPSAVPGGDAKVANSIFSGSEDMKSRQYMGADDPEEIELKEELSEMIDKDMVARLGLIGEFLKTNHQMDYLDKLVTERTTYLLNFLVVAIEKDNYNPYKSESKESEVHRYVRGTHQAIFLIRLTFQLVHLEAMFLDMLLRKVVKHQLQEDGLYAEHVGKILDVPVDYLCRRWQKVASHSSSNPLINLDMLSEYNSLQKDFSQLLITPDDRQLDPAYNKLLGLQKTMTKACGRAFIEYDALLAKQKERVSHGIQLKSKKGKHKGLPSDGTVWHVSVKTLNFLLNGLMNYRETLEHPCMQRCNELRGFVKGNAANTTVGSIVLTITETLKNTLIEISKGYRNTSLAQIFLLNNFHFIQKRIKESGLLSKDIKNSGFVSQYQKLMDAAQDKYASHSWDRALEYVSILDSQKILKKCEKKADGKIYPDRWAKASIKSKFKEFNERFAKQYEDQSVWSVPDADLRSQIRNRNMKKILDAYELFYMTYHKVQFSRNMGKHLKYTPRNLKAMLESLLPD